MTQRRVARNSPGGVPRARTLRWPLVLAAVAVTCAASGAAREPAAPARPAYAAELVASLPPYRPREQVSGTVRLWGHGSPKHDFLGRLLRRWTEEFRRYQPRVRIVERMYGTASAIGALYTGAGNLAILGEEISPAAQRAFERERHYAPTRIEIATGSLDTNYFDYAHMVFVNRANPIARMSLGQLAAVFGDAHGRGARRIRTWGELGLTGAWAHRPIHPYFWKVNEDFALFFRARVLHGDHHWNPAIREFVTHDRPDGSIDDRGQQILQALAADPDGIAVSNIRFAGPQVKALALAASRRGPYVSATPQTLITQRYPLTRIIPAFVDLPPGQALAPAVREFLRFILSREGQQALLEDSGYLPLGRPQIASQLRKLGAASRCHERCAPAAAAAPVEAASRAGPAKARDRLRIWGNPQLTPLVQRWVSGFQAIHPGVRVELHMTGSDTAIAGLYTREADLALMGRAATDSELKAFEWIHQHPPLRVGILRGSVETRERSPALTAFVHRGNPLQHIDLAQLRALIEARPRPGAPSIVTWGGLGLSGRWAAHPIDLYIPDSDSGTGRFLRDALLGGSALLAWPRITEIRRACLLHEPPAHTRGRILGALARDPYGLAIAWLPGGGQPVSPVPLGAHAAGPYVLPTPAAIRDGRYPLGRPVYAYLDPRAGVPSEARQFVRYVLSAQGQDDVARADGYLPLDPRTAARSRARLCAGDPACE
jgi:phosphate transport system substrate-binding protein